jgi:Ribonucleotide reductase, barrel domain.
MLGLRGNPLHSVAITDAMNIIGKVVVAGNIRRTAEIGFAEPEDEAFASMKNWRKHPVEIGSAPPPELLAESPDDYALYEQHQLNPETGVTGLIAERYADRPWAYKFGGWRWASNNSVRARVGMDYRAFDEQIAASGEPGFFWEQLARDYGRMKDPPDFKDHRVMGANPCVEQSLESYEMCNLVENYPSHADDYWDFQRSMKFSYLYAKAVTLMGTHVERTNEIISRNRRIGCSMSGVADAIAVVGRTKFFTDWCERGYQYIKYLDRKYSDWLGVRESIKRTSEKPSGTVSLLAGVFGPGAHFPKPTGFRLMRLAAESQVAAALVEAGYRVEPAVTDPTGTVVAYFPWIVPEGVLTESDASLWEQVKIAADLQHWWADNQVSYTATFSADEAERGEIARVLEAYDGQIKGISFLAKEAGNYAQMPFTVAPRREVEAYAARLRPLRLGDNRTHEAEDNFCDGAACVIPLRRTA